mgnify:CR=1 FL=1
MGYATLQPEPQRQGIAFSASALGFSAEEGFSRGVRRSRTFTAPLRKSDLTRGLDPTYTPGNEHAQ